MLTSHGVNDPTHAHGVLQGASPAGSVGTTMNLSANNAVSTMGSDAAATGISIQASATGIALQVAGTGASVVNAAAGGGGAHNNMPPTMIVNYIIRVL